MTDKPMYPRHSNMNDYYTGVGRVSNAWAHLEMRINHAIWRLANVEQYAGACMTSQINAPMPRFRALIALARHRGASERNCTTLNKMSHRADGLARRRNRFIHDPSFSKDRLPFRLNITADRSLDFDMKPVEMQEFADLEKDIDGLMAEFDQAMRDLFDKLPAFGQTQFTQSPGIDPLPLKDQD